MLLPTTLRKPTPRLSIPAPLSNRPRPRPLKRSLRPPPTARKTRSSRSSSPAVLPNAMPTISAPSSRRLTASWAPAATARSCPLWKPCSPGISRRAAARSARRSTIRPAPFPPGRTGRISALPRAVTTAAPTALSRRCAASSAAARRRAFWKRPVFSPPPA